MIKTKTPPLMILAVLFLPFLFLSACANNPSGTTPDVEHPDLIVKGINRFGFNLTRKITNDEEAGKNIVLSPLSIHVVLSMTWTGSSGKTEKTFSDRLGLNGLKRKKANALYQSLLDGLTKEGNGIKLNIGNAIRIQNGTSFSDSFRSKMNRFYDANAKPFSRDPAEDARNINDWVREKTESMIEEIVSPADLRQVVFLLLNAIYFKGTWTDPFDKNKTGQSTFHLVNNESTQVPMMSREGRYGYLNRTIENGKALRLPYGNQERFGMTIVLPNEGQNPKPFFETLMDRSPEQWNQWSETLENQKRKVRLSLPRFEYKYGKKTLNPYLQDMGFPIKNVNLDQMGLNTIQQLDVFHKAAVKVNEQGTEAAAASGAAGLTSVPPKFNVNRPFLFVIRDSKTGLILFTGIVYEP